MKRFLAYEAYVAYHEIVHEEASITSRLIPTWSTYERGVEALSASINAIDQKEACARKGMTLSDLGIKVSMSTVQGMRKLRLIVTADTAHLQVSTVLLRSLQAYAGLRRPDCTCRATEGALKTSRNRGGN